MRYNPSQTNSTPILIRQLLSVSRVDPVDRAPYEAENLDNVSVTLERKTEKRNGFRIIASYNTLTTDEWDSAVSFDLPSLRGSAHDLWSFWYSPNKDVRFLFVIDYNATGITDTLFHVYQIKSDGTWKNVTPEAQWDPANPGGTLTGSTPAIAAYMTAHSVSAAQAIAAGVVSSVSRSYLTYGSGSNSAKDVLHACTAGIGIIIANRLVKAGFSSDVAGKRFDLGGVVTATDDIEGRPVTYFTASKVVQHTTGGVFDGYEPNAAGTYIPVEDYSYYDTDLMFLGQKLTDLSKMRIPPDNSDLLDNNGNGADTKAAQMLALLYDPFTSYPADLLGRGKVYYLVQAYKNVPSGWYRIVSLQKGQTHAGLNGVGSPYIQRVRTPDEHSYLDPRRMPQIIDITSATSSGITWVLSPIRWTPRETGTKKSNPGPSVFKTDSGALKHVSINAMCIWKERLWLAAENSVFCSRQGTYYDMFLADADSIVSTDPIDVTTPGVADITSLKPFEEYLFISTKGAVQYTLGSGTQTGLSPVNVLLTPTSYYGTSNIVSPENLATQMFFFDSGKLFMYASIGDTGFARSWDASARIPGYLPESIGSVTSAPAQDLLFCVDGSNPNTIYNYRMRLDGKEVIQNSFYRHVLRADDVVLSAKGFDGTLYLFVKSGTKFYLYSLDLTPPDTSVPFLDRMFHMQLHPAATAWNCHYNSSTGQTTFRLPAPSGMYPIEDAYVVLGSGFGDAEGIVLQPVEVQGSSSSCDIIVEGRYDTEDAYVYVGTKFMSSVELSEQFYRDQYGNAVEGVLSLKSLRVSTYNTSDYQVVVSVFGDAPVVHVFNEVDDGMSMGVFSEGPGRFKKNGEFVVPILGRSEKLEVVIRSDTPTPMQITALEFKGKFTKKYNPCR